MKTAIISGCDNNYFYKYLNLYNSLVDNNCFRYADICFVNISVTNDNLEKISQKTKKIVEPTWDFKIPLKLKSGKNF